MPGRSQHSTAAMSAVFNNPNLAKKILGRNFFVSNVQPTDLKYMVQNGLLKSTTLKKLPPDILDLINKKMRKPLRWWGGREVNPNPLGYHVSYFGAPSDVEFLASKYKGPSYKASMVAQTPSVYKINQHSRTAGEAGSRRTSRRQIRDKYVALRATSKNMRNAYNSRGGLKMALENKRNLAKTKRL